MHTAAYQDASFLEFYKYLTVLTEQQIVKLRNIAIGLSNLETFSEQEIQLLEARLQGDEN